ncbi:hypothetical protein pb186bvf_020763, partial [Paramecium bursaria]
MSKNKIFIIQKQYYFKQFGLPNQNYLRKKGIIYFLKQSNYKIKFIFSMHHSNV